MKLLKGAIIFLLGAGAGSGVTYAVLKKKYDDELNKSLEELRESYRRKLDTERDKKIAEDIITEEGYVSYDNMSEEEVRERMRYIQDRSLEVEHPVDDEEEGPFIIDEPAFSEDELFFEKVIADYYIDDSTLVAEGDVMLNADDCIGYENLERFVSDDDVGVIYIRNRRLATDYEVTKIGGSYSEIIGLGGDDEDD